METPTLVLDLAAVLDATDPAAATQAREQADAIYAELRLKAPSDNRSGRSADTAHL